VIGYDPVREGAMKLVEAKDLVLSLMLAETPTTKGSLLVDPASPDGDPGKFLLAGKVARAIHHLMAGMRRSIWDGSAVHTISR
jgi:hypothetical protein